MKTVIKFQLIIPSIFLSVFILIKPVLAEESLTNDLTNEPSEPALVESQKPKLSSKPLRESKISPQKVRDFQDKEKPPIVREDATIKGLYQGVKFVRLRSLESVFIVNSGTTEEKPHFSSVKGFSVGANVEFPISAKYFSGGTPLAKVRMGKTTIDVADAADIEGDNTDEFSDALGASELYTVGFGGGYCYHTGFNCAYALYNTSFTGQLANSDGNNSISAIPTKLKGVTLGMSSTFDVGLGLELSAGMEYSMMKHLIPTEEAHKFNTLGLVFALGFVEESRYKQARNIEFIKPAAAEYK